jgi:membrane associated rhomboid family serine protease
MLGQTVRFGGPLTPVVKKLLIINGAVFLLIKFLALFGDELPRVLVYNFGLSHQGLLGQFKLWQLFTYMFVHENFFHVLMNLVGLWMFSGDLEQLWGSRRFLRYYIAGGAGAGVCIAVMNYILFESYGISPPTLGASGALYAVLLAYGLTWPEREVLVWFILPVKMKYLVVIFGLIEFFGTVNMASGAGSNISHIGHLGGILSGFIFIMAARHANASPPRKGENRGFIAEFFRRHRLDRKKQDIALRIEAKRIIDELLEKIARQGMSSLTPEEKKKLEWARRHYYPNGHDTMH